MQQKVVLALSSVERAIQYIGGTRLLRRDVHLRLQLDDLRAFLQQWERYRDDTEGDQDQPGNPPQQRPCKIRRIVVREQVDSQAVPVGQRRLHAGDRQARRRRRRYRIGNRRLRRDDQADDQFPGQLIAPGKGEVEPDLVGPERCMTIELVEERIAEVVFGSLRDRQRLRQVLARGQADGKAIDPRIPQLHRQSLGQRFGVVALGGGNSRPRLSVVTVNAETATLGDDHRQH